jgi:hypothetical protein
VKSIFYSRLVHSSRVYQPVKPIPFTLSGANKIGAVRPGLGSIKQIGMAFRSLRRSRADVFDAKDEEKHRPGTAQSRYMAGSTLIMVHF